MSKLSEVLAKLSKKYVLDLQREILAEDLNASGKLVKSIQAELTPDGFEVSSDVVYSYLLTDKGYRSNKVGGKDKFDRLGEWARKKGMQPLLRDKKGRFKKVDKNSYRRLGFLLARSMAEKGTIKRYGYKGSNILNKVSEMNQTETTELIVEALKIDIIDGIKADIKLNNIKIQ